MLQLHAADQSSSSSLVLSYVIQLPLGSKASVWKMGIIFAQKCSLNSSSCACMVCCSSNALVTALSRKLQAGTEETITIIIMLVMMMMMMKAISVGMQTAPGSGTLPGPGTPRPQQQAGELFCLSDTGALELITPILYQGTAAQSLSLGDGWSLPGTKHLCSCS